MEKENSQSEIVAQLEAHCERLDRILQHFNKYWTCNPEYSGSPFEQEVNEALAGMPVDSFKHVIAASVEQYKAELMVMLPEIKAKAVDEAVDACPMETCFSNSPFNYIQVNHLLEYAARLRQKNNEQLIEVDSNGKEDELH